MQEIIQNYPDEAKIDRKHKTWHSALRCNVSWIEFFVAAYANDVEFDLNFHKEKVQNKKGSERFTVSEVESL